MTTNTDILTLTQLLSPSFPVGAFAYAHGLEMAVLDDRIAGAQQLTAWLTDLLECGGAFSDAILMNCAMAATTEGVQVIDENARAFAASAERLKETDLQGAAFCEAFAAVWHTDLGRLTYPVAVGCAARLMGVEPELTVALFLQSVVGNLTAAAMRLIPLGQVDGQKVQLALKPLCLSTAKDVQTATLDDLNSCAFLSDIAAMRHETQYSRIFRT